MFLEEMESERKEAQDKKVADTILRLLNNLKLMSNDNNKVRWVWELVQNAKDVVNINKNNVGFSHNGKEFTTKNSIYLIEQVSSKDREIEESEDQRNDYIRDILEANMYLVKDQTRQGTSNSGKDSGEVDILIHEQSTAIAIIEALNLDSFNVGYLNTHINKIYKYDTLGTP